MTQNVSKSIFGQKTARARKICLVRAPTITNVEAVGQDAVPPVGLAYIGGSLKTAGHTVIGVDAVGAAVHQYTRVHQSPNALLHGLTTEEIIAQIPKDSEIIGVSCMFSVEWLYTRALIEAIRGAFPNVLLIVGGEHITACPEYSLQTCTVIDVGILGEGEEGILELIEAYSSGRPFAEIKGVVFRQDGIVTVNPSRSRVRRIDEIPEPDWTIFPVREYIENALTHGANLGRTMPILGSRGCPYQCTFCSNPAMWTTLWVARKPENVIAEIKKYMVEYKATNFDFYDLTAIVKKDWILEFCDLLQKENLNITWQLPSGTRSEAIDGEVARALYASGCRIINYAPESGSDEELKRIKKKVKVDRMLESMRSVHKEGMQIKVNFIFGLPGSSWKDIRKTFKFILQLAWLGVEDVACFGFSPYPGSELFRELIKSGRISLNDEYFQNLLAYTDPANAVSYVDFLSARRLSMVNMIGMAFFYGSSWLIRPHRGLKVAWSFLVKDTSTKLTMALSHRSRKRMAMNLARSNTLDTVVIPPLFRPKGEAARS
jgi:anaerobic magnesium-protoporphyrin IX monomethyl ester cyclase